MSISIGMVGLGAFGPSFVRPFKEHPQVNRIALCDLDAGRLAKYSRQFKIAEIYHSLDDILSD